MLVRVGTAIFLTLNLMVFTMALWSGDVYGKSLVSSQMEQAYADLFRYLSLIVSAPVMLMLGPPLARSAWAGIRCGKPGTDLLIVVGVWAAFLVSVFAVFSGQGPIYFEVACVVLIFVTLGRWLEASGKLHTQKAMDDLAQILPSESPVLRNGHILMLPVAEIAVGDTLALRPGDRTACDCTLATGEVTTDEQIITGESLPLWKKPGDRLPGGSLLLEGTATANVTATVDNSTVARLIDHVRSAREARGRYARMADRIAGFLLPAVLLLSTFAGILHYLHSGPAHGFLVAMSIMLIACPCAVGLATPLAVWSAMGEAARRGILFADGESLEKLAELDTLYFDKTGTLTTGQPRLVAEFWQSGSSDNHQSTQPDHSQSDSYNRILYSLASRSGHPLAVCLAREVAHNKDSSKIWADSSDLPIETRPGRGMILYQDQQKSHPLAILGSPALLAEIGWKRSPEMAEKLADEQAAGRSILIFAEAGQGSPTAMFSFDETLRLDARQAIAELKSSGKIGRISILTGDHPQAAARLATELGVEYQAALLPHEKQEIVAFDRATGHRVGFVGEGYNDAPAMALADVGLALGAGADLTRDNASVCILGNDIAAVPWVLGLSRRTVRQIRRNLFWAFFYNIIGLVFATLGLLSPTMAAAIMFVSSVAVVSGSWQKSVPGTTSAPEAFPAEVSREWPSTAH
jgi:heavy metal translocating P-type ATPase